ncbi:MAG: AmmeMemoRadiSam system protein A [Deltaproteobacteria bacterium]|nr:AmmeMemoRadiSam system protein A [Deltaproteobacteria bacterium]
MGDRRAAWVLLAWMVAGGWGCKQTPDDSRTSAPSQLAGDHDGNSSYGSHVTDDFKIGPEEKKALLALARASIDGYLKSGQTPPAPSELAERWPQLAAPRACFVTLRLSGELRGCIGSLEPRRSLIEDVRLNAVSAAVNDPRFHKVTREELSQIDLEISVLDVPRPLQGVSVAELPEWLRKNKPGLIIEHHGRRSTFLPSVWEDLPDPYDFLDRLCRKQGSPSECWRDPATKLSVYGSIKFEEKEKEKG